MILTIGVESLALAWSVSVRILPPSHCRSARRRAQRGGEHLLALCELTPLRRGHVPGVGRQRRKSLARGLEAAPPRRRREGLCASSLLVCVRAREPRSPLEHLASPRSVTARLGRSHVAHNQSTMHHHQTQTTTMTARAAREMHPPRDGGT